jgi:hypothetical protein
VKAVQRLLMGLAVAMGAVPTDAHWVGRLQHLRGEFRRTPADWWAVVFAAGVFVAFGGLCAGLMIGTARDPEPLFAPRRGLHFLRWCFLDSPDGSCGNWTFSISSRTARFGRYDEGSCCGEKISPGLLG